MNINQALEKLVSTRENLTEEEALAVFQSILHGECSSPAIAAFLTALRFKGESVSELMGGYKALMSNCSFIEPCCKNIVDIVGTGGDLTGTFNISTAATFVASAAGVCIAKHGNRSVSSKSGSADVFEKLGINLTLSPDQSREVIEKAGVGFLFAPVFHSAMRHVGEARREMKIRTIFNILGPICNPAKARRQVVGVFDHTWARKIIEVLKDAGSLHVLVVTGSDGMDEITLTGTTKVTELKDGEFHEYSISTGELGLAPCSLEELKGGEAEENAAILMDILGGKDKTCKRDIVLANAGAAIYVSGKAASLKEGVDMARKAVESGKAIAKFNLLKQTIADVQAS